MRKVFTNDEDAFIQLNYKSMSYEKMSQEIVKVSGNQRDHISIKGRMYRLRLKKGTRGVNWSKDEEAYLWEIHKKYNLRKIPSLVNDKFGNDRRYFAVREKLCSLRDVYRPKNVSYAEPFQIAGGPISITRRALIHAMTHIDETAYTLAKIIRKLTKWSMTEEGVVLMMTVTGMPVRYATPEVKEFLNIKEET